MPRATNPPAARRNSVGSIMEFNPYHKWLGVPVSEQPPNHYRLLGIALFENDADVIETAADQRMALLRTFQTGQYAALSQRLLNELATARLCLLDPASRQEYDEELRRRLTPAPVAVPVAAQVGTCRPSRRFRSLRRPRRRRRLNSRPRHRRGPAGRAGRRLSRSAHAWLALAAVAIPAAICVGYLISTKRGDAVAGRRGKSSSRPEKT